MKRIILAVAFILIIAVVAIGLNYQHVFWSRLNINNQAITGSNVELKIPHILPEDKYTNNQNQTKTMIIEPEEMPSAGYAQPFETRDLETSVQRKDTFPFKGRMELVGEDAEDQDDQRSQVINLILYFGDQSAEGLLPEQRQVDLSLLQTKEELVLRELIKGPRVSSGFALIPKETVIRSVKKAGGLCTIDLSEEFISKNPSGASGEVLTIYSIVNSLTEIPEITEVQFLIDGKKRESYIHMDLLEPYKRDQNIIKK